MTTSGLIPRKRLRWIPTSERLAHEFCYFLHDHCVRLLVEYEAARAQMVTFHFRDAEEVAAFEKAAEVDSVNALRAIGRHAEARRVVVNTITFAMVSDCMHHVFEALHCLEKRKFIVALNLLRKPLLDSLPFLCWMLGDEDGFLDAFTTQSPAAMAGSSIGNRRRAILAAALEKTTLGPLLDAHQLEAILFDDTNKSGGLYPYLQQAVHLITIQRPELRTDPENFNFIFKRHSDDDVYTGVYSLLPTVLLFLSHVIMELFDRMRAMDPGSKQAFVVRTTYGFHLVERTAVVAEIHVRMSKLAPLSACPTCSSLPLFTRHNLARALLTDSLRCGSCRKTRAFPLSWLF